MPLIAHGRDSGGMKTCASILVVVRSAAACDPMLSKAVALARRCGARIQVLFAERGAMRELAARLAAFGFTGEVTSVLHDSSEPLNERILRHVAEHRADLVMTSADCSGALRRVLRTAEDLTLAVRLDVPLMRVGARPWRGEMRFAAALDLGDYGDDEELRSVLRVARVLATPFEATIDVLYQESTTRDERLRMARAVRMAKLARDFHVDPDRMRALDGPSGRTISQVIAADDYDVVFASSHSRRPGPVSWQPSVTTLIAGAGGGDVMLVRQAESCEFEFARREDARPIEDVSHP
jgi:hypothetical protein